MKKSGRVFRGRPQKEPTRLTSKTTNKVNRALVNIMVKVNLGLKDKLEDKQLSPAQVRQLVSKEVNKYRKEFEEQAKENFAAMNKKIALDAKHQAELNAKELVTKLNKTYNSANSIAILKKIFENSTNQEKVTKRINKLAKDAIKENVKLIKTLDERLKFKLYKTIVDSYEKGASPYAAIQNLIVESKQRPLYSVRLLTTNQGNRLATDVARITLQGAGFNNYIWRHTSLSKVPREMHLELDGTLQDWNNPPIASVNGERAHPMELPNCNCMAVPVISINPKEGLSNG